MKMNNRAVYIGLGFHSDVDAVEIENAIHEFLEGLDIEHRTKLKVYALWISKIRRSCKRSLLTSGFQYFSLRGMR